jgi:hypothetical protein
MGELNRLPAAAQLEPVSRKKEGGRERERERESGRKDLVRDGASMSVVEFG